MKIFRRSQRSGLGKPFAASLNMTPGKVRSYRGGGRTHRILVIEDNHDSADTLGEILKLLGHEVRVVYTGLDGVRVACAWMPTVVLSDIGLPELDGFEVARALRE